SNTSRYYTTRQKLGILGYYVISVEPRSLICYDIATLAMQKYSISDHPSVFKSIVIRKSPIKDNIIEIVTSKRLSLLEGALYGIFHNGRTDLHVCIGTSTVQ
ncbi:hypothetical protein C0J52_09453, partial [Blattella germanica]